MIIIVIETILAGLFHPIGSRAHLIHTRTHSNGPNFFERVYAWVKRLSKEKPVRCSFQAYDIPEARWRELQQPELPLYVPLYWREDTGGVWPIGEPPVDCTPIWGYTYA